MAFSRRRGSSVLHVVLMGTMAPLCKVENTTLSERKDGDRLCKNCYRQVENRRGIIEEAALNLAQEHLRQDSPDLALTTLYEAVDYLESAGLDVQAA